MHENHKIAHPGLTAVTRHKQAKIMHISTDQIGFKYSTALALGENLT